MCVVPDATEEKTQLLSIFFPHPLAETSNLIAENYIAVTQPDVGVGYLNHSTASRFTRD